MPRIHIRHPHALDRTQVAAEVEKVAESMAERYATRHHWEGDCLQFSRPGVEGSIAVGDKDVEVHVRLGMLLAPLAPAIEREIGSALAKHFG